MFDVTYKKTTRKSNGLFIYVWFEGKAEALKTLTADTLKRWPNVLVTTLQLTKTHSMYSDNWIFVRGFVFDNPDDAMLFKLSY